jgi:hypothetical protein
MVQCPICLDYDINEYKLDPCNHIFNQTCIFNWTLLELKKGNKPRCPLCRTLYQPPWGEILMSIVFNHYDFHEKEIMSMLSITGQKKLKEIMES